MLLACCSYRFGGPIKQLQNLLRSRDGLDKLAQSLQTLRNTDIHILVGKQC